MRVQKENAVEERQDASRKSRASPKKRKEGAGDLVPGGTGWKHRRQEKQMPFGKRGKGAILSPTAGKKTRGKIKRNSEKAFQPGGVDTDDITEYCSSQSPLTQKKGPERRRNNSSHTSGTQRLP